jgi:hypothetical protein
MLRLSCSPPWSKHTLAANAPEEERSLERKNRPSFRHAPNHAPTAHLVLSVTNMLLGTNGSAYAGQDCCHPGGNVRNWRGRR